MDIVDRLEEANKIIVRLVEVLDKKYNAGNNDKPKTWEGFVNCNRTEIGTDIDRLIKRSKKYLNSK
jgi:N-acetyl-anhydromuramyl-L-alanine amidase AmpD